MSKPNQIRKKAQEYIRKRDWRSAIREYQRLVELDSTNPNLYNELGDLHLKMNDKLKAFKQYGNAVEAYRQVRLYNNAIAVCKKLLRLDPGNLEILFTLGQLRKAQGLTREAVSYFVSFMDKMVLNVKYDPGTQREKLLAIASEMPDSPEALEKVSQYLLKWEFKEEASEVLSKLLRLYRGLGFEDRCKEIEALIAEIGGKPPEILRGSEQEQAGSVGEAREVEGGRAEVALGASEKRVAHDKAGGATDYGNVELGGGEGGKATVETEGAERAVEPAGGDAPASEVEGRVAEPGEAAPSAGREEPIAMPPHVDEPVEDNAVIVSESEGAGSVHVSKIIDEFKDEVREAIEEEDYKTHYDLGMAYLEMGLFPEALREFQTASSSAEYRVSSLEMIGLCFIKQNYPKLAVKQLEKGLAMLGETDKNALGILYTLGLAYEMVGDIEKAKSYFEEVYVMDVSFRDVEERLKKLSS